jgi:uncharacterized protein YcbK (DUF882 family)
VTINLDARALQKIHNLALDAIKQTTQQDLDPHLLRIVCILKAFEGLAQSSGHAVNIETPKARHWVDGALD